MLILPEIYKRDVDSDVLQIDTIVIIHTDPIIYISTKEGNLISSTIEGTPEEIIEGTEDVIIPGELIFTYEEFYNEMSSLFPGTDEQSAELEEVIDSYEELYPPLWEFAHEIMDWFYRDPNTPTPSVYACLLYTSPSPRD